MWREEYPLMSYVILDLEKHHLSVFEQILGWGKMLTMRLAREHSVYHRPCDWIVHEWCYDDLTLVGHLSSNADTIFWASYNSGMRNCDFDLATFLVNHPDTAEYIFSLLFHSLDFVHISVKIMGTSQCSWKYKHENKVNVLFVSGHYFQMHINICYGVVRWRVKGFPFYDNDTLWACILQINCIGHYGLWSYDKRFNFVPKLLSVVSNWNFGCARLNSTWMMPWWPYIGRTSEFQCWHYFLSIV